MKVKLFLIYSIAVFAAGGWVSWKMREPIDQVSQILQWSDRVEVTKGGVWPW